MLTEAKHAWSLARQKSLSKADRAANIAALMRIIRGKVKDIVFKHDASRIIQTASPMDEGWKDWRRRQRASLFIMELPDTMEIMAIG